MRTTQLLSSIRFFLASAVVSALLYSTPLVAQPATSLDNTKKFFFDALTFQGTSDSLQRLDIFVVVPYQHIQFIKQDEQYNARFIISTTVRDSTGKKIADEQRPRALTEKSYEATIGAAAQFDYLQSVFTVPPGTYSIDVRFYDKLAKTESTRTRKITVLPFYQYPFAISSIMLASAVAQTHDGITITPHITDDITMLLGDNVFAFFETYQPTPLLDSADFVYEVIDDKNNVLLTAPPVRKGIAQTRSRLYLRVALADGLPTGTYTLRVLALRPGSAKPYPPTAILAASEHSVRVDTKVGYGPAGEDELSLSIRQMRYAANPEELSAIENGSTVEERRQRFLEFWQRMDPTPNTQRNEAYEQYYQRIEYANATFRSYTEGWLTDMGMAYIIFGPPNNTERQAYRSDGRVVEIWYYPHNRKIAFVDYSGFGDFRLATPLSASDRYRFTW